MDSAKVMSKATISATDCYQVLYHQNKDILELEIGGTSVRLNASNFMRMNEMMRKAAARLVMETDLR